MVFCAESGDHLVVERNGSFALLLDPVVNLQDILLILPELPPNPLLILDLPNTRHHEPKLVDLRDLIIDLHHKLQLLLNIRSQFHTAATRIALPLIIIVPHQTDPALPALFFPQLGHHEGIGAEGFVGDVEVGEERGGVLLVDVEEGEQGLGDEQGFFEELHQPLLEDVALVGRLGGVVLFKLG